MNRNKDSSKNKSCKPFRDSVFYLDLRNFPQYERKLVHFIKLFGGRIEGFLNSKVKYVITDKPQKEWPTESGVKELHVDTHDEDSCSSKTHTQTNSNQMNIHNPFLSRPELYSRGKLLVSKTAQSSTVTTTTDPLEIACKRRIRLLPVSQVLMYCESYAERHFKTEDYDLHENNQTRIKTLRGHYIKIEDNEKKFRPSCKEFTKWPEVNLESPPGCSPFSIKKKKAVETVDATPVATVTRSLEQISIIKEKLNLNKAESITTIPTAKKQRATLFCEICAEDFTDTFENHVDSLKHRRFVMNNQNFEDLITVIRSLPNFEVESGEKIEIEAEEPKTFLPTPRSSPTATTFTLTSGATKTCGNNGTFVRLHDYIQQARSNSSPPATQLLSCELQEKDSPKEIRELNDEKQNDDLDIIEASAVTPVKDPLRILRNRVVLVSEEF